MHVWPELVYDCRLEVSCLVRMAHASSMMTDVSRLLFDEGAEIIEADTLLDGDYVSMFYVLRSSACGPRCWKTLLSKIDASASAASRDVAPPQPCTCQVLALRCSHALATHQRSSIVSGTSPAALAMCSPERLAAQDITLMGPRYRQRRCNPSRSVGA